MLRFSGVLGALVLAGVAAVAGAETVYKWVDGSGQVHFTDLPPRQSDARVLGVYQQEAGTVDEESGDESGDGSDGDDSESESDSDQSSTMPSTPQPPPSEAAMAAAQADTAKAQAKQCEDAKARYQSYIDARRLFREVDGKRVYLTDQELTNARARAKQDVDDYCS